MINNIIKILSIIFILFYTIEVSSSEDINNDTRDDTINKKYTLDVSVGADRYFGSHRTISCTIINFLQQGSTASEIRFPLNTYMLSGNINLNIKNKCNIQFNLKKNIGPLYGESTDTDWVPLNSHKGIKFCYSNAKPYLANDIIPDLSIVFNSAYKKHYLLKLGLGLLYEYIDFRNRDAQNYLYSLNFKTNDVFYDFLPAKVMTYKLHYLNIYFEMIHEFSFFNESLLFDLGFKWAPCTFSYSIDDHILRSRKTYGYSMYGTTIIPLLRIKKIFKNRFFIEMEFDYQYTRNWCVDKAIYYYHPVYNPKFSMNSFYDKYMEMILTGRPYSPYGAHIRETTRFSMHVSMGLRFEI